MKKTTYTAKEINDRLVFINHKLEKLLLLLEDLSARLARSIARTAGTVSPTGLKKPYKAHLTPPKILGTIV